MRNWLVAFAAALLIVLGYAVGPLGVLVVAVTFWGALLLLQADELGFRRAWTTFGYEGVEFPPSGREGRARFAAIFRDRDKVVKALTITLGLTALSLILPTELMLAGVLFALGWTGQRIRKRHPSLPVAPATNAAAPAVVAIIAAPVAAPGREVPFATPAPPAVHPASTTMAVSVPHRGAMPSASAAAAALLARGRWRRQRLRRRPSPPKRKSPAPRKSARHLPLHLKVPLARREIRRAKRPLKSPPKLARRAARRPGS